MALVGLSLVLAGLVGYVVLLFLISGFTYRTWIFDAFVATGMAFAVVSWWTEGQGMLVVATLGIGVFWFGFSRVELRLRGSTRLALKHGDHLPALTSITVNGRTVTERDLTSNGTALLTLYRGWWCPTSKVQLDTILSQREALLEVGVTLFAGSVDGPEEAKPIQEHVGDAVTILCDIPVAFLDEIGLHDQRGAPWYDRLLFGAKKQPISMPAVILLDMDGRVISADRSSRIDDESPFAEITSRL